MTISSGFFTKDFQAVASATRVISVTVPSGVGRKLVVSVGSETSFTLNVLTFNSISFLANLVIDRDPGGGAVRSRQYYYDIPDALPTGAYNINVTLSASTVNYSFYADILLNTVAGAPRNTGSNNGTAGTSISTTIDVVTGDFVTAHGISSSPTNQLTFPAGVDFVDRLAETNYKSAYGSRNQASTQTLTVTLNDPSAGIQRVITLAGWIPLTGPVITLQPTGESVEEGGDATFTCEASGGTAQWQEKIAGSPVDITGETTGTLTLNDVLAADDGREFRCAWTDSNGTTYSDYATLTVGFVSIPATMPATDVLGDTDAALSSTVAYDTVPGKIGYIAGTINGVTFVDYFLPETP